MSSDEDLDYEAEPKTLMDRYQEFEEKYDYNFLKFENIPESERLHPSDVLCGFLKIASLLPDPSKFDIAAEHDICYVYHNGLDEEKLSDEDLLYLMRCGFHVDSDSDGFATFC